MADQKIKKATNRLKKVCRNAHLLLDIQKLDIPVGFKTIQIVIVFAVSFGNHTFCRSVSYAFQKYSRSKVVLKLKIRGVS